MPKRIRTERVAYMQRKYAKEHKEQIREYVRKKKDEEFKNKVSTLVQHHIKYKEIHGYDDVVWITAREHRLLHNRLRREGKCNVPGTTLREISKTAYSRTDTSKEQRKKYKSNFMKSLVFRETLGENVRLLETITINTNTNEVGIYLSFSAYNGYKLKRIDEK